MSKTDEDQRLTGILVLAVIMAVFGGTFQYGYNIAVVNAPAHMIHAYFFFDDDEATNATNNLTTTTPYPSTFSNSSSPNDHHSAANQELTDQQRLLWAVTVSIFTVGGIVGSGIVGMFTKKFGRKGGLLVSNGFSFVGAILMGCSKTADSLEMIIVARLLLGIFSGLATGLVPMYLSEIAPKKVRGALGVVNQLAITIGILTAQLLGLDGALGTVELWPLLLAFTAIPSAVQLLLLPFLPESPRYLLIDRKQENKARNALIRLRGTREVGQEIREMRNEAAADANTKQSTMLQVVRDRTVRWQVITIAFLHCAQQLCGINAIFFYLNTIFAAAGVEDDMQSYASCIVGTVNVLMTIVSVVLTDRVGRKNLMSWGYAIAAFFCILMTISLALQEQVTWISNMSIASVVGFIVGFAIGPGPIPWILQTECFRQSTRAAAGAFGTGLNWTCNFIVALIFPFMQKAMGAYVFVFFLVVCIMGAAYVVVVVPETKNKTFQEISLLFAKRNKLKSAQLEMGEEQSQHIVRSSST